MIFHESEWYSAVANFVNRLQTERLWYPDDEWIEFTKEQSRKYGDIFSLPAAGTTIKGAKIAEEILAKLVQKAGKADAGKFVKAVEKGIVGPFRQSGIKVLSKAEGKYTHELKIGGSAQRLLGCVNESGQIIFDKFVRGGLH